jgi:hypothetical protein
MPFPDDTNTLRNLPPAAAAAALGLRHDPEKQLDKGGKSGSVFYRTPKGDIVICIPNPREAASPLWQVAGGRWTDCLGVAQQVQGLPTIGHAKAFLRRSISFPLPSLSSPSNPTPEQPQPTPGIRLTTCPTWAFEWLAMARGISAQTLEHSQELRLLAGVQREQFVNLAFPYTANSETVGAEVRGLPTLGARQFRGFEGARSEAFFILPPLDLSQPARAVVVVEAAIDALAFLDWSRQAGKPPAWVLATGGEPTTRQPAAMLDFCKEMGADLVVTAQDNDAAGASQAAKFGQAAEQAGMRHKRLTPPTGCKDWGDWAEGRAPVVS